MAAARCLKCISVISSTESRRQKSRERNQETRCAREFAGNYDDALFERLIPLSMSFNSVDSFWEMAWFGELGEQLYLRTRPFSYFQFTKHFRSSISFKTSELEIALISKFVTRHVSPSHSFSWVVTLSKANVLKGISNLTGAWEMIGRFVECYDCWWSNVASRSVRRLPHFWVM